MQLPTLPTSVAVPLLLAGLLLSHAAAYYHGQTVADTACQLAATTADRNDKAEIIRLQARLASQQDQAARDLQAAEARYQENLHHVQTEKDRMLADHAAGRRRLSVPVKPGYCPAAGPAANSTGGSPDPAPRAELSDAAAAFLVDLAGDADATAVELNRCADRVGILTRLLQPAP